MKSSTLAAAMIAALMMGAAPSPLPAAVLGNLKVEKTLLSASPAHPGEPILYEIVVTNLAGNAPNATMTDDIYTKAVFNSLEAPSGWVCLTPLAGEGGSISCTNSNFPSGSSAIFTLTITILPQFLPLGITNTAVVSQDFTDSDPSDNSSTVETPVTAPPLPAVPVSPIALAALAALIGGAGILLKR